MELKFHILMKDGSRLLHWECANPEWVMRVLHETIRDVDVVTWEPAPRPITR